MNMRKAPSGLSWHSPAQVDKDTLSIHHMQQFRNTQNTAKAFLGLVKVIALKESY